MRTGLMSREDVDVLNARFVRVKAPAVECIRRTPWQAPQKQWECHFPVQPLHLPLIVAGMVLPGDPVKQLSN